MEEFTILEMEFLGEIDILPEEYIEYLLPPLDEGLRIPCKEGKVGDIKIEIFPNFIHIKIGNHTDIETASAQGAALYLKEILSDSIVFYLEEDGAELFRFDEIENLSETDMNYYVWSGPFRYVFLKQQSLFDE